MSRRFPTSPRKASCFGDISPLLREKLYGAVEAMLDLFTQQERDALSAFVGLDARGFIFAPAMGVRTGKGYVMARKGGKRPEPTRLADKVSKEITFFHSS